jgi:hypothetical protein
MFCSLYGEEKKPVPNLLNIGSGVFDIIHNPDSALFQIEYRGVLKAWNYARPLIGMFGTTKASFYFYGGMAVDIFLGKKIALTPSFAPGIYVQGKGKNLWFPLEFRSSLELSYILPNDGRLGAQFYHISNASIGRKNPGTEALVFFYSLPIHRSK